MRNCIHLAGEFRYIELPIGATAIKPGMLCSQGASGVIPHNVAGGRTEAMFAQEDPLQGRSKTDSYKTAATVQSDIGDVNAKGDIVPCAIEANGSMTLALLKAGTNYTIGMQLASSGAGLLQNATTGAHALATNLVALDLSASGAVDTLNEVRVI